jgi:hypothetical protein
MNNPFAPQPSPAPTAPNPFAPVAAAGGVAAIQAAFAAQPAAPTNPFAQPVTQAPVAPAPFAAPPQATAFAPLNPPGEAGLGGPPPAPPKMRPDDIVEHPPRIEAPTFTPPAAPKRSRKPRAKADAPALVGGHYTPDVVTYDAEAVLAVTNEVGAPIDLGAESPDLSKVSTEDLREALKSRGWTVTLEDS